MSVASIPTPSCALLFLVALLAATGSYTVLFLMIADMVLPP